MSAPTCEVQVWVVALRLCHLTNPLAQLQALQEVAGGPNAPAEIVHSRGGELGHRASKNLWAGSARQPDGSQQGML